jgi:hypothetical protein
MLEKVCALHNEVKSMCSCYHTSKHKMMVIAVAHKGHALQVTRIEHTR